MDEVRMTGSPSASQLVRRVEKQASPDASIVEKSSDTVDKSQAPPAADQTQVQDQAIQDRRQEVATAVKRLNDYRCGSFDQRSDTADSG